MTAAHENKVVEFCGCGASVTFTWMSLLSTAHVLNDFRANHRCLPVEVESESSSVAEAMQESSVSGNVESPANDDDDDTKQVAVAGTVVNSPSGRRFGFS